MFENLFVLKLYGPVNNEVMSSRSFNSGTVPGQVCERIKFYSQNINLLPPKPKSTFRHLKQGIQDFHRKYVLVPADKAANNVVVV